jgi:hypothetical protein
MIYYAPRWHVDWVGLIAHKFVFFVIWYMYVRYESSSSMKIMNCYALAGNCHEGSKAFGTMYATYVKTRNSLILMKNHSYTGLWLSWGMWDFNRLAIGFQCWSSRRLENATMWSSIVIFLLEQRKCTRRVMNGYLRCLNCSMLYRNRHYRKSLNDEELFVDDFYA